jgi:hypothetical protein
VLNVIDPVKVVREMAERLGVPMTMLRSSEEVAKLVKEPAGDWPRQAKAALMHASTGRVRRLWRRAQQAAAAKCGRMDRMEHAVSPDQKWAKAARAGE